MTDQSRSIDLLGTKPIADAALVVTKGSVDGAGAFLSRICLPAAEEFGLLLKDKVSNWRANNAARVANKAEKILGAREGDGQLFAHPLLIGRILEHSSWQDDDVVQNMWAGILASSCDEKGDNQHNVIYTHLLEQITSSQAHFISYICQECTLKVTYTGLVKVDDLKLKPQEVLRLYGNDDINVVDVELDHLRQLGLLNAGFIINQMEAEVSPTALCLNFFVRCQGYVGSVSEYFNLPPAEGPLVTV